MNTIKDVAKLAGVAVSTASYALNNNPKVSEATREKVLMAAKELNYQPNATARNLKKQKTETIGLFLNDLGGPFYSEIVKGVQEVVSSNGYNLVACSTHGGDKSTAYRFLKEKRVDGAIILAPNISDELIINTARENFPLIVLDRELQGEHVYSILIDNTKGAYEAVNYLINLGHKKIGYLSGPTDSYDNKKRCEGYKKALEENNIPYENKWTIQGKFTEEGGYHALKMLIACEELPEAFFSANDEMAIGAMRALNEAGIKVPEEVAIIGFDDIRLSSYVNPPLTTISQPKYELGTIATHMIFQALEGNISKKFVLLPTKLIERKSCGE